MVAAVGRRYWQVAVAPVTIGLDEATAPPGMAKKLTEFRDQPSDGDRHARAAFLKHRDAWEEFRRTGVRRPPEE
jgi:hypothetical protein